MVPPPPHVPHLSVAVTLRCLKVYLVPLGGQTRRVAFRRERRSCGFILRVAFVCSGLFRCVLCCVGVVGVVGVCVCWCTLVYLGVGVGVCA